MSDRLASVGQRSSVSGHPRAGTDPPPETPQERRRIHRPRPPLIRSVTRRGRRFVVHVLEKINWTEWQCKIEKSLESVSFRQHNKNGEGMIPCRARRRVSSTSCIGCRASRGPGPGIHLTQGSRLTMTGPHRFRPTGFDALEERLVLSPEGAGVMPAGGVASLQAADGAGRAARGVDAPRIAEEVDQVLLDFSNDFQQSFIALGLFNTIGPFGPSEATYRQALETFRGATSQRLNQVVQQLRAIVAPVPGASGR